MDGARFHLQDQTGKVLVDSYSAEYDLPESPPRVVDGAHIAPLRGTGASDEELLQYVHRAGANVLAAKMEHWLDKKGPQDDPRREQGRQTLLEMVRLIPQATTGRGKIPVDLIDKIAATHPLDDPAKEQMRQMLLQHIRETGGLPIPQSSEQASGRYRLRESLILPGRISRNRDLRGDPEAHDSHDRNMIVRGQNEKTFLISWKAEPEVRARSAQAGSRHGVWRGGAGAGLSGFAAVAFGDVLGHGQGDAVRR